MKNALTWSKPVAIIPIDFQLAQGYKIPKGYTFRLMPIKTGALL